MNIHEYQAKQLLSKYGVLVPKGKAVNTLENAKEAAESLNCKTWVVKAQIHAGGRGKGGGVKIASSLDEVYSLTSNMLGMNLITHQTGPEGKTVNTVYIEQGCEIQDELYLGVVLDRSLSRFVIMASTEGGTEIEKVAADSPEKISKISVNPSIGIRPYQCRQLAFSLGLKGNLIKSAVKLITSIFQAIEATDASLLEINPLVITKDQQLLALDAKINFDDNALYRQPSILSLRDETEEDPLELEASKYDLNYIKLEGNIGCMVNGAGLAMATMDIIKLNGGSPANFLDVGGGATGDKVTQAFKLILSDKSVKAVLVNIFGGIMRCDIIAEGIVKAVKETSLKVPLVVRLEGTNVDIGKKILSESGLEISSADNLGDAAKKVVSAVRGA